MNQQQELLVLCIGLGVGWPPSSAHFGSSRTGKLTPQAVSFCAGTGSPCTGVAVAVAVAARLWEMAGQRTLLHTASHCDCAGAGTQTPQIHHSNPVQPGLPCPGAGPVLQAPQATHLPDTGPHHRPVLLHAVGQLRLGPPAGCGLGLRRRHHWPCHRACECRVCTCARYAVHMCLLVLRRPASALFRAWRGQAGITLSPAPASPFNHHCQRAHHAPHPIHPHSPTPCPHFET